MSKNMPRSEILLKNIQVLLPNKDNDPNGYYISVFKSFLLNFQMTSRVLLSESNSIDKQFRTILVGLSNIRHYYISDQFTAINKALENMITYVQMKSEPITLRIYDYDNDIQIVADSPEHSSFLTITQLNKDAITIDHIFEQYANDATKKAHEITKGLEYPDTHYHLKVFELLLYDLAEVANDLIPESYEYQDALSVLLGLSEISWDLPRHNYSNIRTHLSNMVDFCEKVDGSMKITYKKL